MIEPFIYPAATLIAGVDEVGRGPLVGAVVTAAVILDPATKSPINMPMPTRGRSRPSRTTGRWRR